MMRRAGGGPDDAAAQRAAEFERLVRGHIPSWFATAYRWTGGVDSAEDLVQDLLVKLFSRLDEIRQIERLRPWAARVMYRLFVDRLRRENSSPVAYGIEGSGDDDEEGPEIADDRPGPPQLTERQLAQEALLAAWSQLSAEHRVVLAMHEIEGYTLAELADVTGTTIGTLKSRLHRARARLRELLLKERFEPPERV